MASEIPHYPAGTPLRVDIVKRPMRAAARKTLQRVLAKGEEVSAMLAKERHIRKRNTRVKQRGGRPWEVTPRKFKLVRGEVGEGGVIPADLATLRDLRSVSEFIEVKPAK